MVLEVVFCDMYLDEDGNVYFIDFLFGVKVFGIFGIVVGMWEVY